MASKMPPHKPVLPVRKFYDATKSCLLFLLPQDRNDKSAFLKRYHRIFLLLAAAEVVHAVRRLLPAMKQAEVNHRGVRKAHICSDVNWLMDCILCFVLWFNFACGAKCYQNPACTFRLS